MRDVDQLVKFNEFAPVNEKFSSVPGLGSGASIEEARNGDFRTTHSKTKNKDEACIDDYIACCSPRTV